MQLQLTNALKPFERADEVEIDCGGGWKVILRQAASYNQDFRAAVAKYAPKDNRSIVSGNSALTGSEEADYELFCDYLIIGWKGLVDDNKKKVEYSKEVAVQIFKSSKQGRVLYSKLMKAALDENMFTYGGEEKEIKNL